MLPLQENVGHVFAAEGFEGDGVFDGSGDLVRAIDLAQGDDLLDVMGSIEAFVLEFAAKQFGLRREVEEGQQQSLIACLFTLGQQFLGVIGIGLVLAPIIAAEHEWR